jgi:hypothetical protein
MHIIINVKEYELNAHRITHICLLGENAFRYDESFQDSKLSRACTLAASLSCRVPHGVLTDSRK